MDSYGFRFCSSGRNTTLMQMRYSNSTDLCGEVSLHIFHQTRSAVYQPGDKVPER